MFVPDVNVLIYAAHRNFPQHDTARQWFGGAGDGAEPVGMSDFVLSSYVRISTNPRLLAMAITTSDAFADCARFRALPTFRGLVEGFDHWEIFEALVRRSGVTGTHVTDAYLAAFAIENNATFVTFDRGFTKFPGLQVLELP